MRRFYLILAVLIAASTPLAAMTSSPALTAAPSHYASIDGARVHYKVLGKGRVTLVFVHGLGGEMNVWREQAQQLSAKNRVLVVDLPGYGQSDKPEKVKYSMRYFARAIRAAMDDAKIDRAVLVGHSMGAAVIREFDRMYPSRTRALVVVDGALVNNLPPEAVEKFIGPMRGPDYVQNLDAMFDAMTGHASPPLRMELKAAATATPQYVLVSSMEAMFDPSVWKQDKITVPLLVINTTSPMWTAKYVDAVRAMAHDLRYMTIDESDHFIMLEQPDALNEAIEKWMKSKGFTK
jgi:pimeloyl-ACP methyl ester carboxylesterase